MARHTHSEFAILIAFPLQKRFNERTSMLRFTYIACIVDVSQTIRNYPGTFELVRKVQDQTVHAYADSGGVYLKHLL